MGYTKTLQNLPAREREALVNETLAKCATPSINRMAIELSNTLAYRTTRRQQVGINTAREIIAALGWWLNANLK
jgi:hypothetical protein